MTFLVYNKLVENEQYEIIIYRSNVDNVFIAEIAGLKSSTAHGESHNKTLREVSVVANKWITIA